MKDMKGTKDRLFTLQKPLFLVVVVIPCFFISIPPCFSFNSSPQPHCSSSVKTTEFNISSVTLSYQISLSGSYQCAFTLQAKGNSRTALGTAQAVLRIYGFPIEDVSLQISGESVSVDQLPENNTVLISFSFVNHSIPEGFPFTITGQYRGSYLSSSSSVYTYSLGIDWGTLVGSQLVTAQFVDEFTIILPIEGNPVLTTDFGISTLTWSDMLITRFHTMLLLHPRILPNTFLSVNFPSFWNATIGRPLSGSLLNNGTFELQIWIVTPNWIYTNVTEAVLPPNQQIGISFEISSDTPIGTNGSIDIVVGALLDPIKIPVFVVSKVSSGISLFFLTFFFFASSFSILGLCYYKRDEIWQFIQIRTSPKIPSSDSANSFVDADRQFSLEFSELSWDSIQLRWESILPEKELEVIKVLFSQGSLNQTTLAQYLDVSDVTISRIISRLENKRLLIRERFGMSNMIKLDRDRL